MGCLLRQASRSCHPARSVAASWRTGGSRYNPTTSTSFSSNFGSLDSSNVSTTCGFTLRADHTRCTIACKTPNFFAIGRHDQCVSPSGPNNLSARQCWFMSSAMPALQTSVARREIWRCWPSRRRRGTGRCSGRGCCCWRRRDWRIFGSLIRWGEPGYGHGVAVAGLPSSRQSSPAGSSIYDPAPPGPNRAWPTQQRISCDRWCLMTKHQPQPPAPTYRKTTPPTRCRPHLNTRHRVARHAATILDYVRSKTARWLLPGPSADGNFPVRPSTGVPEPSWGRSFGTATATPEVQVLLRPLEPQAKEPRQIIGSGSGFVILAGCGRAVRWLHVRRTVSGRRVCWVPFRWSSPSERR